MLTEEEVYKLDKPDRSKSTDAIGTIVTSLPRSSNALREIILSVVSGEKSRKVLGSFVEKKYNHYLGEAQSVGLKSKKLQQIFSQALQQGKINYIPLPPTLRVDETKNAIVVTKYPLIYDKQTPHYAVLLNKDECKQQVTLLAEIAFNGGVTVDFDTFAIDVDPRTYIGKVILLDLDMGCYIMTEEWKKQGNKNGLSLEWWRKKTEEEVQKFLNKIDSFQDNKPTL